MNSRASRPRSPRILPALAAAIVVAATACGDDGGGAATETTGGVSVVDAWVREPAAGQENVAGYATITNDSGATVTLVGATAPLTATFELHETLVDDEGVMSMRPRQGGFAIADGETFTLEPGGPHVMMFGVDPAELTGDVELTFVFDGAEPVTAVAELRPLADDEMHEMDEMDGMDMGETDARDDGSTPRVADPMDGDDMTPVTSG